MKKIVFIFTIAVLTITLSGCGTPPPSPVCSCSGNIYNCDDFNSHREAQECFEYCGGASNDVHELDRDKDGSACELNP